MAISAKVAVSAATYWIDRPYDYSIPAGLEESAKPGCRVMVPFSRGSRVCEGIILSTGEYTGDLKLKELISVVDSEPVLDADLVQLALFMRERYFCTVYDAVRAMLPTGMWIKTDGTQRTKDRTVKMAALLVSPDEAEAICRERLQHAPKQAALLRELAAFGELPSAELLELCSAGKESLSLLEKNGFVEQFEIKRSKSPLISTGEPSDLPVLSPEQQGVYSQISAKLNSGFGVSLIQGITGSGKTSVYVRLIADVLSQGKSAVMLVPEIALTPQTVRTFSAYFGTEVAVLHSSLTVSERYSEYKRVKDGKARLVIGTRSAVFAPVSNPGIFIIDEEQDDSYRSENNPRYTTCEVAKYRCWRAACPLVLGSATPSVATRYLAQQGTYSMYRMDTRYNQMTLPAVKIVDMKKELRLGNGTNISSVLHSELAENIERGEQSILLINRRGARKLVTCGECGYIYKCPNCSVSLTYHSVSNRLVCHYCGYSRRIDPECPECGGILNFIGAGTQLIESEIKTLFPNTPVMRMDTDVISRTYTHEQAFERFREENIPVLIGTQMVAKGLNFENVTLVGVISADQSLYNGDYRASEKTFSLLTQVIGRSGRGAKAGRAVIQTFTPSNQVISMAARQDYDGFYSEEILSRELQNDPPFMDFVCVNVSGTGESLVLSACRYIKSLLKPLEDGNGDIRLLGPTPLAVVKVNNRYRYRVILNCRCDSRIRRVISETVIACSTDRRFKGLSFFAEVNPEF